MSTEELIEKAVENLNRIKQLNLKIIAILSLVGNDNVFSVSILDNESGCTFDTIIDENISTQQLLPDDPTNLPPDDIIMLRIAKHIFETYKKFKTKLVNDSLTLNNNQTISSLQIGSATYDINLNGKSLTATVNEVDELKNKLSDLQTEKDNLEQELQRTKSIVDLLVQRCHDKGIL